MTSTITNIEAKDYIRLDHDLEDTTLGECILAAESYIRSLCKPYLNELGKWDTLPPELKQAVLILTSHLFENRGVTGRPGVSGELPFSVTALIANHRDWSHGE